MTDLVSRLLESITAKEEKAEAAKALHVSLNIARRGGKTTLYAFLNDNDPSSVLRRCAADRKILELHTPKVYETDEWDENRVLVDVEYPYCPRCWAAADYPAHSNPPERYPCGHVRLLAESYGLSDHQEGEE